MLETPETSKTRPGLVRRIDALPTVDLKQTDNDECHSDTDRDGQNRVGDPASKCNRDHNKHHRKTKLLFIAPLHCRRHRCQTCQSMEFFIQVSAG